MTHKITGLFPEFLLNIPDEENSMANIRSWLENAVAEFGEPLEAVVVGQHYNVKYDEGPRPDENVILPPDVALKKLDQEFDDGFGGADCFPIFAWTKSWVFFIHEYDGATSLNRVPRHPINIKPKFGGLS